MTQIPFNVSARTARLIGRENVANAEGALIELVKNSYDADAKNCVVYFDNKYSPIPVSLSKKEYSLLSRKSPLVEDSYDLDADGKYTLNVTIGKPYDDLMEFFFNQCSIIIIDNGHGMTKEVIENDWMTIGTDTKEQNYLSNGGRIKTGAKGIGRFALDRLGKRCEIYTLPEKQADGFLWKVNWSDFEAQGVKISDVNAELTDINKLDLKEVLSQITDNFIPLAKVMKKVDLSKGTVIKINYPRDIWQDEKVKEIYEYLEMLVPPKEQNEFNMFLLSSLGEKEFGEITSKVCDDFDYKITAEYLADKGKNVLITIKRNELDINLIKSDFMEVFNSKPMNKFPYDFDTLRKKSFTTKINLHKLIPGYSEIDTLGTLNKIGKFKFSFYFLKNSIPTEEVSRFPYRNIVSATRKAWLDRFGGIKIFRDNFRIRPYGDKGNDWLGLGKRQAESPGGAGQKLGGYRIRPNQVLGAIDISRTENIHFQDKSGREGLQENEVFHVFKQILVGIIEVFENDRNTIMYYFDQLHRLKNLKEDTKTQAKNIANNILKEKKKGTEASSGKTDSQPGDETPAGPETLRTLSEGFKVQEKEIEEKDSEIRLSRSLTSTGLIITSFSHELENLKKHLETRTDQLKELLKELLNPDEIAKLRREDNPYIMVESIKEQDLKLKHWLDFSLSAIKKSRRERVNINLVEYLLSFKETWDSILKYRSIDFIVSTKNKFCVIRAFHIDLDSIFTNLVANSIDAFKRPGALKDRIINIGSIIEGDRIRIRYTDTGCGLSKDFKDPYEIFKPFVTTKRDRNGNKTGTGLGMWIVKNIIDEYQGEINILKPKKGFGVEIILPLTKQDGVRGD